MGGLIKFQIRIKKTRLRKTRTLRSSFLALLARGEISGKVSRTQEGGVRVCGIAVLGYFWCGVAVIFVSKYGIAVFRVQAVCGKFKFYVAVGGEKIVVSL